MLILYYLLASPVSLIFIASVLIYVGCKLLSSPKRNNSGMRADGTISTEAREVPRPSEEGAVQDLDSNPKND